MKVLLLLLLQGAANAWTAPPSPTAARLSSPARTQTALAANKHGLGDDDVTSSRRSFLTSSAAAVLASAAISSNARPSFADDDLIDVYFGCGCFWHVQHEFVEAERTILGRSDDQITSRAGYAGGKAGALDGKVCYHNAQNIADYGKLGHAEVVSMRIPASKFEDFAVEYFKLFDKDGLRPDQWGDRGTEYRNLVGIPGGKSSPFAESLVKASVATGDKLDFAVGKGDDKDLPKVSFIMDTADYPVFVAEQYHQFHDGFKFGENYPDSYNSLGAKFAKKGEDFGKCPNGMMGIGLGGL
eukprot:CAMPEP_0183719298 /NCGR_PEP_ID=MMETSP0737-20130205/12304_1 /TAXON_ID=385413 /ORGANISM="Thalassiosira miniscula, Strain CCMP1093" /LENGTH=297 /DNA_ID=CAMNT_0025949013 /DNA_START=94 /DNA_END=987 /DNA_ORIENTATION=-